MSSITPISRRDYLEPTGLLLLTQTMISWAVYSPPVIAKQALPEMGLDPIWIGAQPMIVFISAMFFGVLASSWVVSINPMRASQLLICSCIIGVLLVSTGEIVLVVIGSAFVGAALGPSTPASSHILARVTPAHLQPLIFSIRQASVALGGVLAGFVTPLLMQHWNWQISMMVIALSCIVTLCVVEIWVGNYKRYSEPNIDHRFAVFKPIQLVLSIPSLRWLTIGMIPMVIAQYCLTTFIVLYLQDDIKLSVITAGWILGTAQASGMFGRILFGLLAGRYFTPLKVLLGLSILAAIASILTSAGWNGIFLAEAARQSPAGQISRVTAGSTFFIFGGCVFGPAAFAILIEKSGFGTAYIVCASLLLLSFYAFLMSSRNTN
jgi:MFS family permease